MNDRRLDLARRRRLLDVAPRIAGCSAIAELREEVQAVLLELLGADDARCEELRTDAAVRPEPTTAPRALRRTVGAAPHRLSLGCTRGDARPPFTAEHVAAIDELVELLATLWPIVARREQLEDEQHEQAEAALAPTRDLFRERAIEERLTAGIDGAVLEISPRWVRWAYWPLTLAFVGALAFVVLGRVNRYSHGPALVRLDDRTTVVSSASGTLDELLVAPGDTVDAGAALAHLHAHAEASELARLESEIDSRLRQLLLDPAHAEAREALASLVPAAAEARARLDAKTLRAPRSGVVGEIHVRPGQPLAAGDWVLSLRSQSGRGRVIALLPGRDRPRIDLDAPLRVELAGYRHAFQDMRVTEIGEDVIGPEQARRFLGSQVAEGLALEASVVKVIAELPATSFVVDGQRYAYHDGMPASARVLTHSEPVLVALFPALRRLYEGA